MPSSVSHISSDAVDPDPIDPELFSQVESGKIVPDPNLTLDQDPGPQQCLYTVKEKQFSGFLTVYLM